ncbi:MAG: phosphoglycerate kinase [Patescibacteria group bacterium]
MKLPSITEAKDLKGRRVLLRLDLNLPIGNGKVVSGLRINKSLKTLNYLREAGAKIIILAHIESPETDSLRVVFEYLKNSIPMLFADTIEEAKEKIAVLLPGEILLIENLRLLSSGEKSNDEDFSRALASLGDVYVNDAFSVSHRNHASIVGVPKFLPHYAGFQLEAECQELSKAFNPEHPALFFLGGNKFETKLPLVKKFIEKMDVLFIGGALSNDIFKAQGLEVGVSDISDTPPDLKEIMGSLKLSIPSDVVVNIPGTSSKNPSEVIVTDKIMDSGTDTIEKLKQSLVGAKFVLWNGPLGEYEKGFEEGTVGLANAIIESGAQAIVGGGNTVLVLEKANLLDKFHFVSTGGGAMLDFLANETLPGIEALLRK